MKITQRQLRQIIKEELTEMYRGYATGRRHIVPSSAKVLDIDLGGDPLMGPTIKIDGEVVPTPRFFVDGYENDGSPMKIHSMIIDWCRAKGITHVTTDWLTELGFRGVHRSTWIPLEVYADLATQETIELAREELSEMRRPEGDPSDPSYRSAMRRYYKSQEQGDEPKRHSAGHGRFPGMDDEDPEPIPRMWFDQGRGADDDLDEGFGMGVSPKKHTFGTKVLATHLPLETLDVDLDFEEKSILSDISDEDLRELIKNPDGPAADRLESEFADLYMTLHDMMYLDAESEAWKKVRYLKDNNVFKWELWRRKEASGKFDPPMGSAYHRLMRGPAQG